MTADTVGGVWTYALDLTDALAHHEVEVHIATMGRLPDAGQRSAASRSSLAGLHESSYALEWEDDPWQSVDTAGEWLLELGETLAPDVVHVNGYAHASLQWSVPVVVAAHSDVISWWRAVRRRHVPPALDEYRRRVEDGLQHADVVCAPTLAVLDDLAASYTFGGDRLVVPNGRASRPQVSIPKEPLVVGLGRFWDEAKNVAALQRVAERSPWRVLLGGPGTPFGRLSPDGVAELLERASIFASPARYEPFGLAALEAAQSGCALLLGDIPSLREVWGDAATYVAPGDDEALLDALGGLCGDDARRNELAARALGRAGDYTRAAMAAAMHAVYERALATAPAGAVA